MKLLLILGHIITLGIFWKPSLEYMYDHVTNAESCVYYVSHFSHKPDVVLEHQWKSPEQFVYDGGGDCEDFAIINYELLKHAGYEVQLYRVENDMEAHVVITYAKHKDIGLIDNRINYKNMSIEKYCSLKAYTTFSRYNWKVRQKYIRNKRR